MYRCRYADVPRVLVLVFKKSIEAVEVIMIAESADF